MSNPTSNFNWQMPTATDLVTDLPADFEVFGQAVDTTMADLKGGTTGQILSKASGTDMDFTWTSPSPGDITAVNAGTGISGGGTSGDVTITNSMATAITTSGDLIQGTGSGTFARLGVGTNGQVLTSNGTSATWASASSGGMTLLSTTTLSGTSTTISSISGAYTDLRIVIYGINQSANSSVIIYPNGTTNICNWWLMDSSGGTGGTANPNSYLPQAGNQSDLLASNTSNVFVTNIYNYSGSQAIKAFDFQGRFVKTGGTLVPAVAGSGGIGTSSAISSIQITTVSGSATHSAGTVLIYGVK